jgi:2'-5' RNA ligase
MTVYDVVLLPSPYVRQKSVFTSESLSNRHNTDFTLKEDKFEPHMSLYMAEFNQLSKWRAKQKLAKIAKNTDPISLTADRYGHNLQEGMFEVFYDKTPSITALQSDVTEKISPLRSRKWPVLNPVGHVLDEWVPRMEGEAKNNLEKYGYEEIGGLFNPHITFTRFTQRDLQTDLQKLADLPEFDDTFSKLALYEMGENGTCTKPVAVFPLNETPTNPVSKLFSNLKRHLPFQDR